MKFSAVFAAAAFAVAVSAHKNDTVEFTTTEVVTSYTTYCPLPTTIVENNVTYTVTEATTLTITNCPCTRTKTYTTVTATVCTGGCPTDVPVAPTYPNVTAEVPAPPANTSAPPPEPESAAGRSTIAAGALAGLIAAAAYLL